MSTPKKCALLFFAGFFLCQLAWIVTLPPFRGIDEVDHAYRAASVAEGQWLPRTERAPHGRGRLVQVPASLVRAAHAQCAALPYTGRDNCNPVRRLGNGQVLVASSAAGYNPLYYGVTGLLSQPFAGSASLYVMRLVSALMCAALIGLAGWAVMTWQRSFWPTAGLLVAMTPMAIYSTSIVAPNGLEMAAAIAAWCCALGVGRGEPDADRRLLAGLLPPSLILVMVRPLGPFFLLAALVAASICVGANRSFSVLRRHRAQLTVSAFLVILAVFAKIIWMNAAETVGLGQKVGHFGALHMAMRTIPLFFLQQFGAFPFRNQAANPLVYALGAPVAIWFVFMGLRVARGRLRWLQWGVIVAMVAGPFLFTLETVNSKGVFWQGRYGLPFTLGVVFVAAYILDQARYHHGSQGIAISCCLAAVLVAQVAGEFGVLREELARRPSFGDGSWIYHPYALVASLTVLGWCILSLVLRHLVVSTVGRGASAELETAAHA